MTVQVSFSPTETGLVSEKDALSGLDEQWRDRNAEKVPYIKKKTTGSSSDFRQMRTFSKWELLLKERICPQREQILSFKNSSLCYGNH